MHKFISALLCSGLLLLPAVGFADALDDASVTAGTLTKILDNDATGQAADAADAVREAGDEIFPAVETGSGASSRGAVIEEDPVFMTARVDGAPIVFKDVLKDAWFAPYVREVVNENIVSGYRETSGLPKGLYGPADNVTIEQLAKIAVLAGKVDVSVCDDTTKNETAKNRWSESFVRCAEQKGWAVFSDGSIPVEQLATRAQVTVTLLQALGAKLDQRTGKVFKDVDGSTEFASSIETAANAGVVSGYADADGNATGLFKPADPVNRAEVAKIVTRGVQVFGGLAASSASSSSN